MSNKEVLIPKLVGLDPNVLAADICSVQPMPNNAISELYLIALPKKDLIEQGYKPASNLGLMWVKDEEIKTND